MKTGQKGTHLIKKVMIMNYENSKVDKALNMLGMFSSFEDIKNNIQLNDDEYKELKERAKQRYGKEVFRN